MGPKIVHLVPKENGEFEGIEIPADSSFEVAVSFEGGTRFDESQLADDPEFSINIHKDRITRSVKRAGAL